LTGAVRKGCAASAGIAWGQLSGWTGKAATAAPAGPETNIDIQVEKVETIYSDGRHNGFTSLARQ